MNLSNAIRKTLNLARSPHWNYIQKASIQVKRYEIPPNYKEVEYPEKNKLRMMEKVPKLPANMKPPVLTKRLRDIRGPEEVHCKLIHKQYGIMALHGGYLRHGHFEMIRNVINRKMDPRHMFAVWRVDAPWKPITKKSQGKRMGGGKSPIHHYATPVKARRIIFEMGGEVDFELVEPLLEEVRLKLPFQAAVVSEEILQKARNEIAMEKKLNQNPFSYEYVVKNSMLGCQKWMSRYDKYWFGQFI